MAFAKVGHCFNIDGAAIMANTKWPGLLSWLLLCDISAHFASHIAPPTARDLANVIISGAQHKGGGQGPLKATRVLRQEWWDMRTKPCPDNTDQLEQDQKAVRDAVVAKLPPDVLSTFCARGKSS
jgi:hypothetical protein